MKNYFIKHKENNNYFCEQNYFPKNYWSKFKESYYKRVKGNIIKIKVWQFIIKILGHQDTYLEEAKQ